MAKISIEGAGKFAHHYPKVATIVTVQAGGKDNAMAVAWHSSISANPPMYGISIAPKRFTLELMLEAKEFGVNFMPIEKAELVASVGGISGRKDKPLKTSVPILRDAYACYECKLIDHKTYGDHIWVVGEILATHFEEELFTEGQALNLERVSPALFMGNELYTIPVKDNIRKLDRTVYGKH
jgi:flavin reductase (DIM6/NTAB) family NADH-FMN oxidoreductase RutF